MGERVYKVFASNMSAYKMDDSNRTVTLIKSSSIIVSNMKGKEVTWIPIYDDWANGWYPMATKEEKENTIKSQSE